MDLFNFKICQLCGLYPKAEATKEAKPMFPLRSAEHFLSRKGSEEEGRGHLSQALKDE